MRHHPTHAGLVAVVTGAGRGIGLGIARMLAARGARVAAIETVLAEAPSAPGFARLRDG